MIFKELLIIFALGFVILIINQFYGDLTKLVAGESTDNSSVLINGLTLNDIFDGKQDFSSLPIDKLITIIATGDILPARSVNYQVLKFKDFTWPYLKTHQVLKNSDITFINLETPLVSKCTVTQKGMVFCGDLRNVEGLTFTGVDVVNFANNHAGNQGEKGVLETIDVLAKNGMLVTGINGPVIKIVKGVKFAFLGYNDISKSQVGISNVEEEKIKREIRESKLKADVVIVAFHWGAEYKSLPDQRQRYLGKLAVDSGADLIIGNHPHWIQAVEFYKGKLITYAHGNFVFDQEWSQKTKEGVLGKYLFLGSKLVDVEYIPVLIENYGQPHFLEGVRKSKILDEMKSLSQILSTMD